MKTPKVVIYMSCYNHEKYVNEAMDSIIGQTYENWELFVVNDGSTDRTGEILASYQDKRIHYYDFKENTRLVGAANFLQDICEKVEADYIAAMSSDDMWDKDKLRKQVKVLCEHPEYKACFTWDKIIFSMQDKGFYQNAISYSHEDNRNRFEWLYYLFWKYNCLNACSMLMDKNVFYELGKMDENYIQLGDYRLWIKLAQKYPFYLLKEELTYYRRHETNLSEPTGEVVIRSNNETYQIMKETIGKMDKAVFRRTFYANLPYVKCDTEEEFLAEKFILFLNTEVPQKEHVAIDIYYDNYYNKKFASVLEENYFFYAQDFLKISGSRGICSMSVQAVPREGRSFSPAILLLTALSGQTINENNLERWSYSTMLDLWELTQLYVDGNAEFELTKQTISDLRANRQEKNKVLFLIASDSKYDFREAVKRTEKAGKQCYVAFVPSRQEAVNDGIKEELYTTQVENAQVLPIYDREEHCLRFLYELSETADIIYYVDCADSRYECSDMMAGYSLATEYNCILNKEIYIDMSQNEQKILAMMNSIEVYDE